MMAMMLVFEAASLNGDMQPFLMRSAMQLNAKVRYSMDLYYASTTSEPSPCVDEQYQLLHSDSPTTVASELNENANQSTDFHAHTERNQSEGDSTSVLNTSSTMVDLKNSNGTTKDNADNVTIISRPMRDISIINGNATITTRIPNASSDVFNANVSYPKTMMNTTFKSTTTAAAVPTPCLSARAP